MRVVKNGVIKEDVSEKFSRYWVIAMKTNRMVITNRTATLLNMLCTLLTDKSSILYIKYKIESRTPTDPYARLNSGPGSVPNVNQSYTITNSRTVLVTMLNTNCLIGLSSDFPPASFVLINPYSVRAVAKNFVTTFKDLF